MMERNDFPHLSLISEQPSIALPKVVNYFFRTVAMHHGFGFSVLDVESCTNVVGTRKPRLKRFRSSAPDSRGRYGQNLYFALASVCGGLHCCNLLMILIILLLMYMCE